MAWLSAALADNNGAPTAVDEPAAPVTPVAEVPAKTAPEDNVSEVVAEYAAAVPEVETAVPAAPAVEPVAEAAPDPRPKRGRSAKATGRRAAKAARSAAAATPAQAAPGRRGDRPSGEVFLADLAAAGSFKALAEKYDKSIGTIGNWAHQLREQGFNIPVGRQKKA
ncbi:hypothetical protein [Actinoplanes sp. NPDC089786]|uniref:hypothetical protein n=1 Tax=Actinoplanes sp. NPDC089786 TaxID=3155185 RepID=UPI00343FE5D8